MPTCPSCASEVPAQSRFCLSCGGALNGSSELATVAMGRAARAPSSSTSSSFDEGRFPAGTLLAERYRIIGLLGRGGMGEVYRANDLKLGQPVAMKFLPPGNEHQLQRFHAEVRIARQVSHPNVCRVYDIAETDGELFLTMEYVDGEDLGSLLRRIGRLPQDKAVQIARKLCAGLAAAHDKGVLHRDLKPANIMIDGRGHVLITDFGLAGLAGQIAGGEIRNGTPAYMAPEQLAGREVSVRSDLYALGLVLYEMFTGRQAFTSPAREMPAGVSTLVKDIDPAVDRVIQRCLEEDPRQRPASALAVAAALPGGDPLAAALAAGETPSPEMVAAAGETDLLAMRTAGISLAIALAGLAAVMAFGSRVSLLEQAPFEHSPEVLAQKARELVQKLGYTERPQDRARGFYYATNFLRWAQRSESRESMQSQMAKGRPAPINFWYRQSPLSFVPRAGEGDVTPSDPAMTLAGMVRVYLDPTGRLFDFRVVTPQRDASPPPPTPPNWSVLLEAAGVETPRFQPAEPEWLPQSAVDARAAWKGSFAGAPQIPVRIEAAAWRGRPVYFQMIWPWTEPDSTRPLGESASERISRWVTLVIIGTILVAASWIGWRNWQLGRGDLRGASRLAGFVVCGQLIAWVLTVPHTLTPEEYGRVSWGLASALLSGAASWVLYVALEPYVRRRWPQSLISWSRLLGGGWRDPLVAGHLLIGVGVGIGYTLLFYTRSYLQAGYHQFQLSTLLDPLHRGGAVVGMTVNAAAVAMALFFLYFLFRVFLRNPVLAGAANVAVFALLAAVGSNPPWIGGVETGLVSLGAILILTRFGLLPMIVGIIVSSILPGFPMTTDFSAWYAGSTMFSIATVLALTAYAFHTARAGRPLFSGGALDR